MQTLVPLEEREPWTVTASSSTDDGPPDDLTIAIDREPQASTCSIRTMLRTGIRLGHRSSVHGQVTDVITTAALAVGSLLLEAIPPGLPDREAVAATREAETRSLTLARHRDHWNVAGLHLAGVDYALFTRTLPEGVAAHADLGWATIAMWSTGPLHAGPFRLANVEPDDR